MIPAGEIHSPCIVYELLSKTAGGNDGQPGNQGVLQGVADRLRLARQDGSNQACCFQGTPDGIDVELACACAHDTDLLRVSLRLKGYQPYETWMRLEEKGQAILGDLAIQLKPSKPWGATRLYQVIRDPAGAGVTRSSFPAHQKIALATEADPTPYGWLWLLEEGETALAPGFDLWTRCLGLVVPEDRYDTVHDYFLAPLNQGLARIELYLQKGKHHARLQAISHDRMDAARRTLQESMNAAIASAEFGKTSREQQDLEKISKNLMRFLTQVASQEVLLNSLQTNRQAFQEHLDLVKMDIPFYQKEMRALERHIEQLTADIRNARAVLDSTYAFQEIHRSVETVRLERASMLMGAAAALLAGVAIFNSFLDIWNLALEGSGMVRPSSGLRILLGFIAGVSLPLAATWFVEKRNGRAVISTGVGVLSVAAAIIATVLVNQ